MAMRYFVAVLLVSLGFTSNARSDDAGAALFKKVTTAAQACASTKVGTEVTFCWIKATPKKCEPQIINYLSSENKYEASHAWYICVASCASAGFWANRFGECSREVQ